MKQEGPEGPGSLTWGKGHSGANNREPQGHNLNNFGRGPFDPCGDVWIYSHVFQFVNKFVVINFIEGFTEVHDKLSNI